MTVRVIQRILVGGAVAGAIVLAGPVGAAHAQITGPCTASIKGVDVGPLSASNPSDAVKTDYRDKVVVEATTAKPNAKYKIDLSFGGFRWTVARGHSDGIKWSKSVNVDKYASHGVGLYKVIGSSAGCSGAALVKVTGKSPLSTQAGIAGAALTGLGALGILGTAYRVLREGARPSRLIGLVHFVTLPMYLLLGMGMAAPPARVSWRPRISILGILSGIFGGIGLLVLLQQYAVAYPTRGLVIAVPVSGVVLNLLLTNLARIAAVRRANARAVPAEAPASPASPAPSAATTASAASAPGFVPTHTVPATGMSAYAEPDDSQDPVTTVDPGLEVHVLSTDGAWAHVEFSNGWTTWVNAAALEEID